MKTIGLISFTRADYPLLIGLLGVGYNIRVSTPCGILPDGVDVANLVNCKEIGIRNRINYVTTIDESDLVVVLSTKESATGLIEFSKHAETYAHSVNKKVVSQLATEQIESSKSDMQELALIPKIVVGNLYTPADSTITFSSIVSEMRKHHPNLCALSFNPLNEIWGCNTLSFDGGQSAVIKMNEQINIIIENDKSDLALLETPNVLMKYDDHIYGDYGLGSIAACRAFCPDLAIINIPYTIADYDIMLGLMPIIETLTQAEKVQFEITNEVLDATEGLETHRFQISYSSSDKAIQAARELRLRGMLCFSASLDPEESLLCCKTIENELLDFDIGVLK
ncbi:hypothetical protein PMW71_01490 [Collinsella aerofaciens]|uniref:hypothetical protein n=1 Tax=Collinsella aerofaciens TaxID=74426 RepID=UPI00189F54CF|nr:hypothetical protein [Collinsella aerofaciens]MDB1834275.1 hypothetical protein [Collinsella aerofaciens]MDB1840107.1 hypothetical protein [Collinsella aerofaciens]MDB1841774.1 hypothetical protein [Collinsella aerofaciens]MDB1849583.1 hypothetical protein [Collinsella aerofaciens]